MARYVFFDENGAVSAVGSAPYVPEGAYEVPGNFEASMLATMVLVERPAPPQWTVDGSAYSIEDCPLGTTVKVADQIGGEWLFDYTSETEDETISFTLNDPGTYSIELHFPFPYLPRVIEAIIE
ncbi:hypothetical protein [Pseudooceanicola sp.]|uniref:hypothetical protein n=1 Tax=Pseudooceanicola sp. TaxID=1914328 RepID=UPI0035C6B9C5